MIGNGTHQFDGQTIIYPVIDGTDISAEFFLCSLYKLFSIGYQAIGLGRGSSIFKRYGYYQLVHEFRILKDLV